MTSRRAVLLAVAALALAVPAGAPRAQSDRPFDMTPEVQAMPGSPAAAPVAVTPAPGPKSNPQSSLDMPPAIDLNPRPPESAASPPTVQPMPPALGSSPGAPRPTDGSPQHAAGDPAIDRFVIPAPVLRLAGEMDQRSWSIALTADEASRMATLLVTYTNAVLVMPEGSRLSVSVNGQRVIDAPIAASEKPAQIAVHIPRGNLRAGSNLLRFQVVQRHRTDCSVESTYELWTEIDGAKTGLRFEGSAPHPLAGLDDLPAVGFDAEGTTHLRLIVPHAAEISAGSDLIKLVEAITLRGLYPHPVVTIADAPVATRQAGTLDVVVASASELPAIALEGLGDLGNHPDASFIARPTGVPLLAIAGPSWADVKTAIDLISQRVDRPLDVRRTVIETATWLAPSPRLIRGEATLSFAELEVPTEEFNGRRLHTTFHVGLPADFYANAYGEARLYLDAAFTDAVAPGSHLDVTVNGFLAANLPLTAPAGDILKRLPIKVSLAHFGPGVNEVTLEAILNTAADATCAPGTSAGGPPRFVLFDTSTFAMPTFARLGRWPNLDALAETGFPYARSAEPTAVVLGRGDADTYSAAATLLARLALAAGRVIAVDTSASPETVGTRNAIFVGAIGQFSSEALTRLGLADGVKNTWTQRPNYAPGAGVPTIDPTGIAPIDAIDAPESSTSEVYRRWNRHLVNPSGLRGQWAAFQAWLSHTFDLSASSLRLVSTSEPPYEPPRRSTIAIGEVPDPPGGQDWTYLLAPSTSALVAGVGEITGPGNWSRIHGRVAAFDASTDQFEVHEASSFTFIPTDTFSLQNIRLIAANWLSVNVATYAFLLVMLCVILGACTSALLARLGRRS